MTRDRAIERAKKMREGEARMRKIAQDWRMPFGERYKAVVMAEEYDEAARRFDRVAEMPHAK